MKQNVNIWKLIDITAIICSLIFLLYRASLAPIYWDGGLTDEMWYIAEPYLVSKGAIPFVNLWSQSSGFTVPLAILDSIFFRNSTEGIVLFHKYFAAIWFMFTNLLVVKILRKKGVQIPYIFVFPVMLLYPHQMIEINYNTIGLQYILLIYALLYPRKVTFSDGESYETNAGFLNSFLAGVLMARTVLGTPFTVGTCFLFAVFLIVKKKLGDLGGYITGGFSYVVLLLMWICARADFALQKICSGICVCFAEMSYLKLSRIPLGIKLAWFGKFMIPFVIIATFNSIIFLFSRENKKIRNKIILIELFFLYFCGLIRMFQYDGYSAGLNFINQFGWFGIFICVLYHVENMKIRETIQNFVWLSLGYFIPYLLAGYLTIDGYENRSYWLFIPTLLMFFFLYIIIDEQEVILSRRTSKLVVYVPMCLIGCLLIFGSQRYLHRMDRGDYGTIIGSGIWKGCRINEKDAKAVVELEEEIRLLTQKGEYVLFLDFAAFGYLMTDAMACTPNTIYGSTIQMHVEDSQTQYNYCAIEGKVPDKIIYIDYGLYGIISIEDPSWQFNQYVNSFYKKGKVYKNNLFRVLEYDLVNENGALEYANEKSIF